MFKIKELQDYFERARNTLEILMAKLGLTSVYHKLMAIYKKRLSAEFEPTLIKLLYRCLLGMRSIQKCQKIFKLHEKRNVILDSIQGEEDAASLETKIANFCLQSSRLFVQVE